MPVLTAALSSLPVESLDVMPIGTLEALAAGRDGSEQPRGCGFGFCGFECDFFPCFGCECGGFCESCSCV
jgi:hypothetical protein